MENKTVIKALAALAQETRLAIFRLLVEHGPSGLTAGRIGKRLAIPPSTLSFHLKELDHAGLVAARQEGRFSIYSANFFTIGGLIGFLTENCCGAAPQGCDTACETMNVAKTGGTHETHARTRRRRKSSG